MLLTVPLVPDTLSVICPGVVCEISGYTILRKNNLSNQEARTSHSMIHKKLHLFITGLLYEITGSILVAIAVHNFALAAKFPMTGFSGIAIILNRFFQIPVGISTIVLNLPVALFCYRKIGRGFLLKSLRCMIISSLFIDCLAPLFPFYTGSRLLAALVTGGTGRYRLRRYLCRRLLHRRCRFSYYGNEKYAASSPSGNHRFLYRCRYYPCGRMVI